MLLDVLSRLPLTQPRLCLTQEFKTAFLVRGLYKYCSRKAKFSLPSQILPETRLGNTPLLKDTEVWGAKRNLGQGLCTTFDFYLKHHLFCSRISAALCSLGQLRAGQAGGSPEPTRRGLHRLFGWEQVFPPPALVTRPCSSRNHHRPTFCRCEISISSVNRGQWR